MQETLLAVHNQRHTYDPALPVTAWVHAIARYKLVDFLRNGKTPDPKVERERVEALEKWVAERDQPAVDAALEKLLLLRRG